MTAIDSSSIKLTWADNSTNETSFEINNGVTSQSAPANATSYTWGGLAPGTYMCFRIRASNAGGNSAWEPNVSPFYRCTTTPQTEAISQRVLLVVYDPILQNRGGQRLHAAYGWQDPTSLTSQVLGDLQGDSHGIVTFNVQTQILDKFPIFVDGFQYTESSWESDYASGTPHRCYNSTRIEIACFDYNRFLADNNIVSQVGSGVFDEVWVYADPMAGMYESTMAGTGSYWLNSNPVVGVSGKAFAIMGWNYQRGVAEAIHSYGHRVESIMTHIYGSWPKDQSNNWGKFTLLDEESPGLGGLGRVHFAVNGHVCDNCYDWANPRYVLSNADDWFNYPNFTGTTRSINADEWSPTRADPQRDYLNWWYQHMPHYSGRGPDGFLNDWWRYIINIDQYKNGG